MADGSFFVCSVDVFFFSPLISPQTGQTVRSLHARLQSDAASCSGVNWIGCRRRCPARTYDMKHITSLSWSEVGGGAAPQCWQESRWVAQSQRYPVNVHLSGPMHSCYPGRQWNPLKHTFGSPLSCSGLWAENNSNEPELIWTPMQYGPRSPFYCVTISCSCTVPERSHWGLWMTFHMSGCLLSIHYNSQWCQRHQHLLHKSKQFNNENKKKKTSYPRLSFTAAPQSGQVRLTVFASRPRPPSVPVVYPLGVTMEVIYAGGPDRCVGTDWACWPISFIEDHAVRVNTEDSCSTRTCWGQTQVSSGVFMRVSVGGMAMCFYMFLQITGSAKASLGRKVSVGRVLKIWTRNGFGHWMQRSTLIDLAISWNCARITVLSPLSLTTVYHRGAWPLCK